MGTRFIPTNESAVAPAYEPVAVVVERLEKEYREALCAMAARLDAVDQGTRR